jgi:hypothetical protein
MKNCIHLRQNVAEIFLEWKVFQTKLVEKIKTEIFSSIIFFRKSCHLWDNTEKCSRARQTRHVIIWHMQFECLVNKARIQIHIRNV